MEINTVIENFKSSYPSREIAKISKSEKGVYVVDAPEKGDEAFESSNMFIGNGEWFAPFNPLNDLDGYRKLMGSVAQVWPQKSIAHSAIPRRWR